METTNMELTITDNGSILQKEESFMNNESVKLKFLEEMKLKRKLCQELYDVKRSLNSVRLTTEEIDFTGTDEENNKEETKKGNSNQHTKAMLASCEERDSEMQELFSEEIRDMEVKIAALRAQELSYETIDAPSDVDVSSELLLNEELAKECMLKDEMLKDKTDEFTMLGDKIKMLTTRIDETKIILESTRSETQTAKEEKKNLYEEIALANSQLNMIKSKPLEEGVRGNGLFAEVDDTGDVLEKKIKLLMKAQEDIVQAIAKTRITLKKLKLENITRIENSTRMQDVVQQSDVLKEKTSELEEKYRMLEEQYLNVICVADPQESDANIRYINHFINKPRDQAKTMRNGVEKFSVQCLEIAQSLVSKNEDLFDVRRSLYLEEAKGSHLSDLLKTLEMELKEKNENIPGSSCNESKVTDLVQQDSNSCEMLSAIVNQEKSKQEKEKKRPQLKFTYIQKINIDEL